MIFFVIVFNLFANPYKDLPSQEKIELFTNFFVNESLQKMFPKKPEKQIYIKENENPEPSKYEFNYNYIQRLKAIRETNQREQQKVDEKYASMVMRYNAKLASIYIKHQNKENLLPIVEKSLNKALKVVYGKPVITNIKYGDAIGAQLDVENIYGIDKFEPLDIVFETTEYNDTLFREYEKCETFVKFDFDWESFSYKELICKLNDRIFKGDIILKDNQKFKLNIKINDDIFQEIIIEDTIDEKNS
jgi:hypothetical protein